MQTIFRLCLYLFFHLTSYFRYSSLSFVKFWWGKITDKLVINWQNYARVRLQLKFTLRLRPLDTFGVKSVQRRIDKNYVSLPTVQYKLPILTNWPSAFSTALKISRGTVLF